LELAADALALAYYEFIEPRPGLEPFGVATLARFDPVALSGFARQRWRNAFTAHRHDAVTLRDASCD
jgi:hypothetical protein